MAVEMGKIGLQIKATLENVEEIKTNHPSYTFFLKIKCSSCGEESDKWHDLTEEDNVNEDSRNPKGFNFYMKCKLCSRENSISILEGTNASYTADDSEKFKTIVCFDCRGVEPVKFSPRTGWIVKCTENGQTFEDVDLSEDDWVEYDEKNKQDTWPFKSHKLTMNENEIDNHLDNGIVDEKDDISSSSSPINIPSNVEDLAMSRASDDDQDVNLELVSNDDVMTSLLALTSHFAQVQFRLRQIVDAAPDDRDKLLQSLEEFAFRGINIPDVSKMDFGDNEQLQEAMEQQRNRQFELIERLKQQLSDVEKFAYESGAKVLPQSMLVEKQKVIIDELKNKVNFNVYDDDLLQLTSEDLRSQVDHALGEFVGPVKMKDTLVSQLKTQITDLERFVAYLQCETKDLKQMTKEMSGMKNFEMAYTSYNTQLAKNRRRTKSVSGQGTEPKETTRLKNSQSAHETLSSKAATVLDKAAALLNIFAVTQFGCGSNNFQKNSLKKTTKGNHWGDLRAQIEVDVQEIISLVTTMQTTSNHSSKTMVNSKQPTAQDSSNSDSDDGHRYDTSDDDDATNVLRLELIAMVRKKFSVTLQKLIEHGLREDTPTSTSLVPFIGCFSHPNLRKSFRKFNDESDGNAGYNGSDEDDRPMHVWELILEYYYMKNGDKFNSTPARKLSQSFNLDIAGSASASNKQSLLSAIGTIISIHAPYKRSYNSHFKALISMGLNCQKLFQWLNLIFQSRELVQQYYTTWSYVYAGFRDDGLKCVDRLSYYRFNLPIDIAVRQFKNIKDVFM
ncbi:RUN domain-containing protein 1 [Pseudolycoriella hygida]|uniref:RUN domain-containing protein 1 n=2 Tax=Pseudolycoriella hygida TaxID=35572 RepID=A0A9Q0NBS5_9DIPT|nr:RUN domain-containing protein 1 [Pseudolycoriella hygida]